MHFLSYSLFLSRGFLSHQSAVDLFRSVVYRLYTFKIADTDYPVRMISTCTTNLIYIKLVLIYMWREDDEFRDLAWEKSRRK